MERKNWEQLKTKYLFGEVSVLSDFLRNNGIKFNGNVHRKVSTWVKDREDHQREIEERAREEITKKSIKVEVDHSLKQIKLARAMQIKGLEALSKVPVKTVTQATRLIVAGLREERAALGWDNKPKYTTDITNNFNPAILGTNYGKKLKTMNDEQLIGALKELDEINKQNGIS